MTQAAETLTGLVRVAYTATVAEARRALAHAATNVALVTDDRDVIGVITSEDLEPTHADEDEPIGDVMTTEVVHILPGTDDLQTLSTYRSAAWASLRRRAPFRSRTSARGRQRRRV